ncbi:hypothetical protein Adt_42786 [Abeliophyllum distichum]|uniref:Aminotransferase-like plant mobile domain-containing protein n=1 Tax=Abeliophyllum distichum TaxID=126358 RepID=A0ABD1PSP4_9LAMI
MAAKNSLSFEKFQTLLSEPFASPDCLPPANTQNHEFHLGPAFNTVDVVGRSPVVQLFPTSHIFPFIEPFPLTSLQSAGIRTWHKSDTNFHAWHKHMVGHGPTRELFERARILDLLELTLDIPAFDPTLFSIVLYFWASNYKTFVFSLGSMFVTLRDISALTNLLPIGNTISPAMIVTHAPSIIEKQFFSLYKQL